MKSLLSVATCLAMALAAPQFNQQGSRTLGAHNSGNGNNFGSVPSNIPNPPRNFIARRKNIYDNYPIIGQGPYHGKRSADADPWLSYNFAGYPLTF